MTKQDEVNPDTRLFGIRVPDELEMFLSVSRAEI